jgi:hypothetical protein
MTREIGEWKPTVDQLKQLIANHRAMKRDPEAEDTLELAVFQWAIRAVELLRAIEAMRPFDVIQGDSIHRLNPGSQQVLNTNTSWAVSTDRKSTHAVKRCVDILNGGNSD